MPKKVEVIESENIEIKELKFQSILAQQPQTFTHRTPSMIKIKDKELPFTLWKDFLKEVCLYLREDNSMLFQQHCYATEDFSAMLFFNDVSDKWVAGKVKNRNQIELEEGLYVVCDLNAKAVVVMVQQLMRTFDLPDIWVTVGV